ncbi:hypothetical protein [Sphingobium fuliginis]|uniref:Uncharacterized protein n=1 Tax=Sphingobium fuliginis (strain ATCC 27551) TaxID=336203 RepID=A0ABQ1F539_SPHSA|nr:hypothetical protein [Sphingobium fuliginis]RYL96611.1 hypothetical protein EWH10_17860 [Sphingobium fuliginis]GFZ99972.1 hypothetical protein GCM10019071_33110 [Sphingobium fuliginis]
MAVAVIITTCTNRKRKEVAPDLRVCALESASLPEVVGQWAKRLAAAEECYLPAAIYGGRGFQEARSVAGVLDARLLIVSAGLGLVDAATKVPPYACTIAPGSADSVASRVRGAFSSPQWWSALSKVSPFGTSLPEALRDTKGLILAALSDAYIEMIADDMLALPEAVRDRVRLFTRAPLDRINPGLRASVMPYDERLDGPDSSIPGTISDFSSRAARHFADVILLPNDTRSLAEHAREVRNAVASWRKPERPARLRLEDTAILEILRAHWNDAKGMSLRRLRGEFNVACEQGRYAGLARIIRSERA